MRIWVSPKGERLFIPAKGEQSMRALGWEPETPDPVEKKPAARRRKAKE